MNEAQNSLVANWLSQGAQAGRAQLLLRRLVDAGAKRATISPLRVEERMNAPLAGNIDHTALAPQTTEKDIERLCKEAIQHGFASVCVPSSYVSHAVALLRNSPVQVCTVVGFPHGNNHRKTKRSEAQYAILEGATEIDMVINIGKLKSGRFKEVETDIRGVVEVVASEARVKVILECALLSEEEKVIACILARKAGAHYVKTSTGFADSGATLQDVVLMRKVVGESMGVKAAGGIHTRKQAENYIAHGATRIGASASVAIVN